MDGCTAGCFFGMWLAESNKRSVDDMKRANVTIGTHGEQYGNWMSNPVFYMFGAGIALAAALTVLSFFVFHLPALGIVFGVILIILAAITCWFAWIRKQ